MTQGSIGHGVFNFIRAVPRDPGCLFIFWEIGESESDITARLAGGALPASCAWMLKVDCLTNGESKTIEVDRESGNWYLSCVPDMEYRIEIGIAKSGGEFCCVVQSDPVRTPPLGISPDIDPEWPVTDEHFLRLIPADKLPLLLSSFAMYRGCTGEDFEWTETEWPLSVCRSENDVQKKPEPLM